MTSKNKNLIRNLFESARTVSFISGEFNLTKEEVVSILSEFGYNLSPDRKWTQQDIEKLTILSSYMAAPEIAEILNKSTKAISSEMRKLGLQSIRTWTKEDEEILMDYWGFMQIEAIANMLNRSVKAIRRKAQTINLLSARNEAAFLKLEDITAITGLSRYKIRSFEKAGLKIKTNYITRKSKFYYIDMEDLVDFFEKNQSLYNAAKFDLAYFPNLEWLKKKKSYDLLRFKQKNKKWSTSERLHCKTMFLDGKTIPQIAKTLNRTENSVRHVCYSKY